MGRILGDLYNTRSERPKTLGNEPKFARGLDYGTEFGRDVDSSPHRLANLRTSVPRFPENKLEKRCAKGAMYYTKRTSNGGWVQISDQVEHSGDSHFRMKNGVPRSEGHDRDRLHPIDI